jgi:SPP1 gp7 family putative phage head morphogenesis protein
MKSLDQKLHDAIISYQLDLRRLEAGTRKRILAIIEEMRGELLSSLVKADELTAFNKARKLSFLRQIEKVIGEYYKSAQKELALDIEGLAEAQAIHAAKMMEATAAVSIAASLPTKSVMERIARDVLIEGGPMENWWARMSTTAMFNVSNAIRQGMAQGETNAQIASRISGKRGTISALDTAKHNLAALVHTSMQTVANDSRLAVFKANDDIIKEFVWFVALDGHVCPRCIALSGRRWKNEEDHAPIGHTVPFQNPPIHWNDRCVLLPVTKTFKELGMNVDEVPAGERASRDGPVSSKTTFDEFLKRQPKERQDEQLGAGRAQLWREGKITLAQLIDGKGRELTLAELRAKYD